MIKAKAKAAKAGVGKGTKGGARSPAAAYRTLAIDVRNGVALLALARPDVHNPFNEELIAELTRVLCVLDSDEGVFRFSVFGKKYFRNQLFPMGEFLFPPPVATI